MNASAYGEQNRRPWSSSGSNGQRWTMPKPGSVLEAQTSLPRLRHELHSVPQKLSLDLRSLSQSQSMSTIGARPASQQLLQRPSSSPGPLLRGSGSGSLTRAQRHGHQGQSSVAPEFEQPPAVRAYGKTTGHGGQILTLDACEKWLRGLPIERDGFASNTAFGMQAWAMVKKLSSELGSPNVFDTATACALLASELKDHRLSFAQGLLAHLMLCIYSDLACWPPNAPMPSDEGLIPSDTCGATKKPQSSTFSQPSFAAGAPTPASARRSVGFLTDPSEAFSKVRPSGTTPRPALKPPSDFSLTQLSSGAMPTVSMESVEQRCAPPPIHDSPLQSPAHQLCVTGARAAQELIDGR